MLNTQEYPKSLEKAIINWVNTFPDLSKKPEVLNDLIDGYILFEIMHKIEPDHFNLENMIQNPGVNSLLRRNNLNVLYENLEKYYINILGKQFDKSYVDISILIKTEEPYQLYNLIEYVLGAVIQCKQKEVYISAILTLDENSQTELMYLIEKILSKYENKALTMEITNISFDGRVNSPEKTNSSFIGKYENKETKLLQKLDELENENLLLSRKIDEVSDQRDRLKLKLNDLNLEINRKSEEIKSLNNYKVQIMKQFSVNEINEDLQNELKFKEKKINELNKYLEELRSQHDLQIIELKDEIDNLKTKVSLVSKMEITLDFYKKKYEGCAKLTERVNELETLNEIQESKIQDYEKQLEAINTKAKKYADQYTKEKDKNIDLEVCLKRKDSELETLKNEKKRFDSSIAELEAKINDQHRLIEQYKHELADNIRIQQTAGRMMALMNNQNNQDFGSNGNSPNNKKKGTLGNSSKLAEQETEKELLRTDIELLSEKCKKLQMDNELLKLKSTQEAAHYEKLLKEYETLKIEFNKLKTISIQNEEKEKALSEENKKLLDEIERLEDIIKDQSKLMTAENYTKDLNSLKETNEILQEKNEKLKKSLYEYTQKNNHLKNELINQKFIFTDIENQKNEELKILTSSFYELAIRNLELEKKLSQSIPQDRKNKNENSSNIPKFLIGTDLKKM